MKTTAVNGLTVAGIKVRTTNANGQAKADIGALWHRFMEEGLAAKLPGLKGGTTYAVYTNYESDHTQPYDLIIGHAIEPGSTVPEAYATVEIETGNYAKFVAEGDATKDAVVNAWQQIWGSDMDRKYTTDFEVYDERAADPTNAIVDVMIAV